jgi:Flp pilus assembly protein TadD/4-amino-4-deoxy-L-arabinose transferase-like glycosyltransferase
MTSHPRRHALAPEPTSKPKASSDQTRRLRALLGSPGVQFAAIVLLAFVVRLGHLAESRSVPFFDHPISDGLAYDLWAQRIVAGDWIGSEIFYQAPLYPYFLALLQLVVGHDLWWVRFAQIALGSAGCGFLFLAGRNLFLGRTGLIAGLIMSLYAPAVFFDSLLQKSVLDSFFMSVLVWLLSAAETRRLRLFAAGIVLGGFILTRENAMVLAPIVGLWLVLRRRPTGAGRRWPALAAFAGGIALMLLPVGVRNKLVGGEFLLTTSQFGTNFYIGNHKDADGMYMPLRRGRADPMFERKDATELAEAATGRRLSPSEVSGYWFGRATDFIGSQPAAWLRLTARKAALLVNAYEIPDAEDIYYYARTCRLIRWLGVVGHFGVLGPLAVVGLVYSWPRRKSLWLWYAIVLTWMVGVLIFFVNARYRFPVLPILVLFAAVGLSEGAARVAARRWRTLRAAAVCALVAGVVANWPIYSKDAFLPHSQFNAAVACLDNGRYERAIELFRSADLHGADLPDLHLHLGVALGRAGGIDEAIAELQRAVAAEESSVPAHFELGTAFAAAGRWSDAASELERTLQLEPTHRAARNNLAVACLRTRDWPRAMRLLRAASTESPADATVAVELAWLLAACPDESLRNGPESMALAEQLRGQSGDADPEFLDLAGAAYASAGRFPEALASAQRALELVQRQQRADLARVITEHLQRYEAGQPAEYDR